MIDHYTFSPDGREILLVHGPKASPADGAAFASIVNSDGSGGIRALAFGNLVAKDPVYRAPDGREIVFVANAPEATAQGLYAVKPDGTGLRSIVAPTNQYMSIVTTPLSPEGTPMGDAVLWDALTGRSKPVPWIGAGGMSYQRLAP